MEGSGCFQGLAAFILEVFGAWCFGDEESGSGSKPLKPERKV